MHKHTLLSAILTSIMSFSVLSMTASHAADEPLYYKSREQPQQKPQKPAKQSKKREHSDRHADRRYRTADRPQRMARPHSRSRYDYRNYDLYVTPHRGTGRHYERRRHDYRGDHRRPYHRDYRYRRPHTTVVIPSRRNHRHYIQVRPFHYGYPHYKRLYHDDDFWGWLAFTAITLEIIDYLNDEQQRAHERAIYQATTSPLGQAQRWRQGDVSGSVTPVWEGPSDRGQYCREYRHDIKVSGRTEIAYGTACRRADGSWEIVQ